MPPRIRMRASKAMKENLNTNNKLKSLTNAPKANRRALADKTNSASDETSDEVPEKVIRRLPTRGFPSNKKNNTHKENNIKVAPIKTPSKLETSLLVNRPRRVCRLPSRFDDHLLSPSKIMTVQPGNASTPLQQSKTRPTSTVDKVTRNCGKEETTILQSPPTVKNIKQNFKALASDTVGNSDTNNNAKTRSTRAKTSQNILPSSKKPQIPTSTSPSLKKSQPKPPSPKKSQLKPLSPKKLNSKVNTLSSSLNKTVSPQGPVTKSNSHKPINSQRLIDKSLSFQVLGGNKKSQESVTTEADVYEFTFDPTEEPKPLKKKRRKPTVKKAVKPKALPTFKRIYDQNISKALLALKKAIKPSPTVEHPKVHQILETCDEVAECNLQNNKSNADSKKKPVTSMHDTGKASVYNLNCPSIRIEDIAADIETCVDHHDNPNYSPVNSPKPQSPAINSALDPQQNSERVNGDPLNLQADLSFFDDVPVASSSMNMSVRHPLASPWRVEFGSLPIKWHSNTYVKPNMTPAVESSFICTEDYNKKKHVYTNMLTDTNESFPQIVSDTPVLKQTSIISFIKEVAEKKAKKKRGRSVSPSKAMAVEYTNKDFELSMSTAEQTETEKVDKNPVSPEEVSRPIETSDDTENSKEGKNSRKRKNDENFCDRPAKSPRKQKDKDCTYFGFDDSEDQENMSPSKLKVNSRGRSLRLKARAVLQEINGPSKAALPIAAKSKVVTSSEAVNKVFEGLKSAADAPVFPEKNVESNVTNLEELAADDSQSVHLFEDIEVVHHLKPTRKSYGKPKKVTFHQSSDSETREVITCQDGNSSFEDDLADLTFEVPDVKEKKKTKKKRPKKLMSKKEEKEAEEWAAGFNSMCEEIEEFELMVE